MELFEDKRENERVDLLDGRREVLRMIRMVYIIELEVSDGFLGGHVSSRQLAIHDKLRRWLGWT